MTRLKKSRERVPFGALMPFLLVTFGVAWSLFALFIFLPEQMTARFGEISGHHPAFIVAVFPPAIAAFSIVLYCA